MIQGTVCVVNLESISDDNRMALGLIILDLFGRRVPLLDLRESKTESISFGRELAVLDGWHLMKGGIYAKVYLSPDSCLFDGDLLKMLKEGKLILNMTDIYGNVILVIVDPVKCLDS